MPRAYTPGLKIAARVRHRCRRLLPIPGDVCVQQGDRVQATDVVAESFLPGDVMPLNIAHALSLPPSEAIGCLLKGKGDRVEIGEPLARTRGLFGFFQSVHHAKVAGTIESVSGVTGQVILRGAPRPIRLLAYLSGEVIEVIPTEGIVIEAEVTFVQGIFGIGGEAFGPIRMACPAPDHELVPDLLTPDMQGAIVVGGARVTDGALARAIQIGVSAVVTGGIDDRDLTDLLGYDLGVAITGSEDVGLTLVITEGFGDIAMAERTWQLLEARAGSAAAVNGATQIRAGVQRPEVLVPISESATADTAKSEETGGDLEIESPVRIIGGPHFGLIGVVTGLPPEPRILDSGSRARVLEVRLRSGTPIVVPRANVERIIGQ